MSGIFDQVINYAPPSLLLGTVTYKGTWSAATNTPTLLNPPSSITNGNYYVVSAAGTQFSLSFNIGDWIISNGSAWEKVDNTDAVSSVFGRTGAVVGVSTDYSAVGITNTALGASNPSTVAATTVTATSTIAATGAVTGSNLSGTNTGDQTITLTGGVTGSGTGSFAATVVTNANLTGVITSSGNATSIASQTGTGTKFVVDTSPVLVTPNIGVATGTSLAAALNGSLGATTPSTVAGTTGTFSGKVDIDGAASTYQLNVRRAGGVGQLSINIDNTTGPTIDRAVQYYAIGDATNVISGHVFYARNNNATDVQAANITSTGLNSTVIGATTAAAGSFTTVSSDAAGGGVGLALGKDSAIRQSSATGGTQYFDVATGGATHGTFRFRGSSGYTTYAVLDSNGAAITGTLSATGNTITFGTDNLTLTDTFFGYVGNSYRVLRVGTVASQRSVALCVDPSTVTGGSFSGTGQILIGNNTMLAPNAAGTDWIGVLRATSGTVVIGPSTSSGELVGGVAGTATFSSTGLAVTGTLSTTGAITSSSPAATNSTTFRSEGYIANGAVDTRCGTIRNQFDTNTGYSTFWTANRLAGGSGYQMILGTAAGAGDVDIAVISSTGLAVTGALSATSINSATGSVSAASATATTLFSASTSGMYQVFAYIGSYDPNSWAATAVVMNTGFGTLKITSTNGSSFTLTLSGSNVQATQSSGSTITIDWRYVRIQ